MKRRIHVVHAFALGLSGTAFAQKARMRPTTRPLRCSAMVQAGQKCTVKVVERLQRRRRHGSEIRLTMGIREPSEEFLAYAYHRWRRPSLRYVLLLGDASYDFKDLLGTGVKNHVPPLIEIFLVR